MVHECLEFWCGTTDASSLTDAYRPTTPSPIRFSIPRDTRLKVSPNALRSFRSALMAHYSSTLHHRFGGSGMLAQPPIPPRAGGVCGRGETDFGPAGSLVCLPSDASPAAQEAARAKAAMMMEAQKEYSSYASVWVWVIVAIFVILIIVAVVYFLACPSCCNVCGKSPCCCNNLKTNSCSPGCPPPCPPPSHGCGDGGSNGGGGGGSGGGSNVGNGGMGSNNGGEN